MDGITLLCDPVSFGEDLDYNIQRAMELAPALCGACQNYHLLYPLKRTFGAGWVSGDREGLAGLVGEAVARAGSGSIDVVIAGAADTQVLASSAHGALVAAPESQARLRFTVLDHCPTPLALCADYAARVGITLATHPVDIVATDRAFPADVVVHHSLFNFIPAGSAVPTLRKIAGWLKPGGRIVFSINLKLPPGEKQMSRRGEVLSSIAKAVQSGALPIREAPETFAARLDENLRRAAERKSVFAEADQVRDLFAQAGLAILQFEEAAETRALPTGGTFAQRRVRAVLAASASGKATPG